MELNVVGADALLVSEKTFGSKFNEALVHQAVVTFLAGARQGTKAQKNRSDVKGGARKPWRQKGSGRARAGSIRSPLWRGGGCTFAARPKDHSKKLNKKMYRGALRAILSEVVRSERLLVVDTFTIPEPKTKLMIARLHELKVSNALIVTDEVNESLYLSARNLPHIDVCNAAAINPVNLISYNHVVMTVAAVKKIEGMLG